MMSKAEEKVWVIPESVLTEGGVQLPFSNNFISDRTLLDRFWGVLPQAFFMKRAEAEYDPRLKQIIPYLVISVGDSVLTYRRAGSEERLKDKISLGIGGHVNPGDETQSPLMTVLRAMSREVEEELYFKGMDGIRCSVAETFAGRILARGLLYYDDDDVGRVHLGVVLSAKISVAAAHDLRLSSENKDLEWRTIKSLEDVPSLENWSRIVVDAVKADKLFIR